MQGIKLLLKILLSVGFAAALITAVTTSFLIGMVVSDTLVVVTEATPNPPEIAVFLSSIEANIVKNIFWVSLYLIGFCLIALYYLYGNFQIFLPPAILAIISFILLQVALAVFPAYISIGLASYVGPIILKGFERAQQANYFVLIFGIALLTASLRLKPKS